MRGYLGGRREYLRGKEGGRGKKERRKKKKGGEEKEGWGEEKKRRQVRERANEENKKTPFLVVVDVANSPGRFNSLYVTKEIDHPPDDDELNINPPTPCQ